MSEPEHGGRLAAEALAAHGVRFVFTLCGGHISPLLLGAKAAGMRVVDVRHEATAVYAADAVARRIDSITSNLEATMRNMNEFSGQVRENPGVLVRGRSSGSDQ